MSFLERRHGFHICGLFGPQHAGWRFTSVHQFPWFFSFHFSFLNSTSYPKLFRSLLSFFFLLIFDPSNPQLPLICPTRSSPAALPASPQVIIDWRLLQTPHKQVPWKIRGLRGSWHASQDGIAFPGRGSKALTFQSQTGCRSPPSQPCPEPGGGTWPPAGIFPATEPLSQPFLAGLGAQSWPRHSRRTVASVTHPQDLLCSSCPFVPLASK